MWDKIKGFVTDHPYLTGLTVFGLGLLIILYYRGGGTATGGGDMASYYAAAAAATASGNQLAAAQIAGQTQNNAVNQAATVALQQSNNQLDAVLAAIGGNTDVEKVRADTTKYIADTAAKSALDVSTLSVRSQEYQSLVTANTLQQLVSILKLGQPTVGNISPTAWFPV